MKRVFVLIFILFFGLGVWMLRGQVRDVWYAFQQPALPEPIVYQASGTTPVAEAKTTSSVPIKHVPVPATSATSTLPSPIKDPSDPLVFSGHLPASVNLAVPFLLQAPTHNWAMPYQEACEEASAIMIDAYYRGRRTPFSEQDGNKAILDLVAFENKTLGYYKDTDATTTARFIREYFGYKTVLVREPSTPDHIRQVLALGYPIIVPASGKALNNPYFRSGGPLYHMLVIKGYLADGRWIVNDPGIGRGADYLYSSEVLWKAMHDWNNGDVPTGARRMVIVLPNP